MIYAGIGSRETPDFVLEAMEQFAEYLALENFTLATGGAAGADTAFITGARAGNGMIHNYLPFPNYNGYKESMPFDNSKEARKLAASHHPAWWNCSYSAKLMHIRNGNIVLGPKLNRPVDFIVCWTVNATATGGTGQALRLAKTYNIPVCNLGNCENFDSAVSMLEQFSEDIEKAIEDSKTNLFGTFKLDDKYYET